MNSQRIECPWVLAVLSIPIFFAVLTSGCGVADKPVNINNSESTHVNDEVPAGGDMIQIDRYEAVDGSFEEIIKDLCKTIGLSPLSQMARHEDFELRLWTKLGALADPQLLGIHSNGNQNNGYFFKINRSPYSIKIGRPQLETPKSGWNKVLFEVRNRLTTPRGLLRDPQFDLNRDEPAILLEIQDKGEYRRVLYGQNTSFSDGKRLIDVCEYLTSEFNVDMDCTGDVQ